MRWLPEVRHLRIGRRDATDQSRWVLEHAACEVSMRRTRTTTGVIHTSPDATSRDAAAVAGADRETQEDNSVILSCILCVCIYTRRIGALRRAGAACVCWCESWSLWSTEGVGLCYRTYLEAGTHSIGRRCDSWAHGSKTVSARHASATIPRPASSVCLRRRWRAPKPSMRHHADNQRLSGLALQGV